MPGSLHELPQVILVAVILALFARTFLFQAFVVPSGSMEQTVWVGDHILVNKFVYAPHGRLLSAFLPCRQARRGDVIVFKFPEDPERDLIKRVVALPGDLVQIRGRDVFVNGSRASLPDLPPASRDTGSGAPARGDVPSPSRIPFAHYFALGDNRDNSYDSRFWGPVPAGNLKGRALLVYWSVAPDPAESSGGLLHHLIGLVRSTRWSRTFLPVR